MMSEETIKVDGFGTLAKDKDLIPVVFTRKKVGKGEVAEGKHAGQTA